MHAKQSVYFNLRRVQALAAASANLCLGAGSRSSSNAVVHSFCVLISALHLLQAILFILFISLRS